MNRNTITFSQIFKLKNICLSRRYNIMKKNFFWRMLFLTGYYRLFLTIYFLTVLRMPSLKSNIKVQNYFDFMHILTTSYFSPFFNVLNKQSYFLFQENIFFSLEHYEMHIFYSFHAYNPIIFINPPITNIKK